MLKFNETLNGALENQSVDAQIGSIVNRALSMISTIKLCRITEITDKKYKVVDLVSKISSGAAQLSYVKHFEIYDCQEIGGNGGFVINRAVGDIVVVGFFDRESTQQLETARAGVLKSRAVCPTTAGVILGTVFYTTPTVNITIDNHITLNGDTTINGDTLANGNIESNGTITAPNGDIDILTISGPAGFNSGGATLTFQDLSGTTHTVTNGLIVS